MKSENDKFNYKKINQHLMKQQSNLHAFEGFLRNFAEGEQKSLSAIQQFTRDMRQVSSKLKSKQISKLVTNFSIHNMELQQIPPLIGLIREKMFPWLSELTQKLKVLKDKARLMESRKNNITQQQIKNYKKQLTQELTFIYQRKEALIKLFCYNMIKNSSHQLQRTTDLLKNQFQNGSKEKRQKN